MTSLDRGLRTIGCLLSVCTASGLGQAVAQTPGADGYHVVRTLKLGGDGRWDYLSIDTLGNRVFIVRQTRVMVVDPVSGKLLAEIPGLDRGHGVALDYATGHGFATSGGDGSVMMFDLKTLRELGKHSAAEDADAILYDPSSREVFTFNGDAGSSTVIDPQSGEAIGSIALGGKPEFAVSAGGGKLYANIEDRAEIVEIDAKARKVSRRWSIAPCVEPTGLAIDANHHRLFSVCHNKLMTISDSRTGKVIATLPIGGAVDGAGFDHATGLAFASNGDGTLTVVHEDSPERFHVVSTATTKRGARTMALDPRSHRIYTITADLGPPPPGSAEDPHPRPTVKPDSFTLLVLEP